MKTRVCNKCKIEKKLEEFAKDKNRKEGYQYTCKSCFKQYRTKNKEKMILYRELHKEERKKYDKLYYEINKKLIKEKYKKYYLDNKDKRIKNSTEWNNNHKEYRKEYGKKWRKEHPNYKNEYEKERLKNDLFYRFISNIRGLIRKSFKRQGFSKSSHTYEILGIDYQDGLNYFFENAKLRYPDFEPKDFLEKNKYHIDHIVPLVTAKTVEDVIRLCHYTNLQLLTKEDNLLKNSKIETF